MILVFSSSQTDGRLGAGRFSEQTQNRMVQFLANELANEQKGANEQMDDYYHDQPEPEFSNNDYVNEQNGVLTKRSRYHMMIRSSSDDNNRSEYSPSIKLINGVLYVEFYLDGASCDHLCNIRDFFNSFYASAHFVFVADQRRVDAEGAGSVSYFPKVQFYSHLAKCILSEAKMFEDGWRFVQHSNGDKLATHYHVAADGTLVASGFPTILFQKIGRYWRCLIPKDTSLRQPSRAMPQVLAAVPAVRTVTFAPSASPTPDPLFDRDLNAFIAQKRAQSIEEVSVSDPLVAFVESADAVSFFSESKSINDFAFYSPPYCDSNNAYREWYDVLAPAVRHPAQILPATISNNGSDSCFLIGKDDPDRRSSVRNPTTSHLPTVKRKSSPLKGTNFRMKRARNSRTLESLHSAPSPGWRWGRRRSLLWSLTQTRTQQITPRLTTP